MQKNGSVEEERCCSFCKNIVTDVNERGCSGNGDGNLGLEHEEVLGLRQIDEQLRSLEATRALLTHLTALTVRERPTMRNA